MLRYLFYLVVGIAAFGVGTLLTPAGFLLSEEKTVADQSYRAKFEIPLDLMAETRTVKSGLSGNTSRGRLTCSDRTIRLVWHELESVAASVFPDEPVGDCTDFFKVEKPYDLDSDGEKEIFIRSQGTALCGAVGKCQLYVFRRSSNSYKTILEADMTQRLNIKNIKTNGYLDIETLSHGSAASGGIDLYQFDGYDYRVTKCVDYDYSSDSGLLKKPVIKPRNCWENGERRY